MNSHFIRRIYTTAIGIKPETVFLLLAFPFGLFMVFLTGPFQAPDEPVHFYRAFQISKGQLVGSTIRIPRSVRALIVSISDGIPGNDQNKISKRKLYKEFSRPLTAHDEEDIDITILSVYSPVPYAPQALSFHIARVLHIPPLFILYQARVANLLVWISLVFLAIRLTPLHPRLFLALSLMPMTVFMSASVSPDAVTNGLSFLWIAYVLRCLAMRPGEMKWRDWLLMGLLVIPLALCKSIYVILSGIVLLLPLRHRPVWKTSLLGAILVIGIALGVGIGWLQLSIGYGTLRNAEAYNMPTIYDITYIYQKPLVFLNILFNTIQQDFIAQARMLVGVLGWVDIRLPGWVYPLYYALLLSIVLLERRQSFSLKFYEKAIILLFATASILLVMVSLFNPRIDVGNGRIMMPQGRYFIPFALLYFLPISISVWKLKEEYEKPVWLLVNSIHIVILVVAVRTILWRYFAI